MGSKNRYLMNGSNKLLLTLEMKSPVFSIETKCFVDAIASDPFKLIHVWIPVKVVGLRNYGLVRRRHTCELRKRDSRESGFKETIEKANPSGKVA